MSETFLQIPGNGSESWKEPVADSSLLPESGNSLGDARVSQSNSSIYIWDGSTWHQVSGGGGNATWGMITGTLSNQIDLQTVLDSKQSTGSYIISLTGDATASGPGSSALTLSTVNSSPGSFGDSSHSLSATVNGKGLITALSANSIQIAESQVTNLISDLAGKQATGNYITTLTGDITASGPGSVTSSVAKIQGVTVSGVSGTGNVVFSSNATVSNITLSGTTATGLSVNRVLLTDSSGNLSTPGEFNVGNSGSACTVNWNNSPAQLISLTTASTTVTLSNPAIGQAYVIRFVQGASATTVTYSPSPKWPGGIAPVITATNGAIDIVHFYYDGTSYYGTYGQNFS